MIVVAKRMAAIFGVALLLSAVVTPAFAGSYETVRDEFSEISFAGDDGSASWSADWRELPFGDGPTDGQIQVANSNKCSGSKCLRFGPDEVAMGIAREANLSGYTTASLTFSYRRELLAGDGDGVVRVRIGRSIWSWETVASYPVNRDDPVSRPVTLDISEWADGVVHVGFFGDGDFEGFFYADNVEIAMSTNNDPSFDASLPNRTDTEGDSITITPRASDPDGNDLSFSATGLPSGVSINSDTGVISGRLGYSSAHASPYTTVVTVADAFGGQDTEPFTWTIADVNRAPSLSAMSDAAATEGSRFQLSTSVSDPDLPYDSLSYTLPFAPPGATINSSGKISWTPAETDGPGTHEFTVRVTDSGIPALSATSSFEVVVSEANRPPVITSIGDQAHGVGDAVSLSVQAADPDIPANRLTYKATGLPPGVAINSSSGTITGAIPSSASQSNNTVTITVKDNGNPPLSAVRTFSWQVTRGNHAPVLGPIPDQQPDTTGVVHFVAAASDTDAGDTVGFWLADGIDAVPAGAAIDPVTGEFSWTPSDEQHEAIYRINVGVSDDGSPRLSDTQLVTIAVPKLNEPPIIVDPGEQSSAEGNAVSLQIDATDDDGLRYAATGLPGGLSINAVTGTIAGTIDFDAAADSPHSVVVTATDDGTPSKAGSIEFVWNVSDVNRPPTVEPISVVVLVGNPTTIDLAATDPDGDELEYEIIGEPLAGSVEGVGPEYVYETPGGAAEDGFSILVSDGDLETRADVAIAIRASNSAPTADPDSYDLMQGESLVVDAPGVMANDSDLDAETLIAGLVSPPAHGVLNLNEDGSFTYTPVAGFSGGDKFVYSVTDALGETSTATVVLNVAAPAVVAPPAIDDGPRLDVVAATAPLWQPAVIEERSVAGDVSRAIATAVGAGLSTVPIMGYPLLLLAVALLLGLTVGRISILPFGVGRRQEDGVVEQYDPTYGVGNLAPDGGDDGVFVQERSLEKLDALVPGQRVRFIAADIRGRRIALKVWPIPS